MLISYARHVLGQQRWSSIHGLTPLTGHAHFFSLQMCLDEHPNVSSALLQNVVS